MNNPVNNNRGAALVVTLAIVAILLAAALQLGKFTGDFVVYSLADNDQFQACQMAMSGINMAMLLLVDDAKKNTLDSVQDVWADQDKIMEAVETLGFEKDKLSIQIFDELSKIQVNALISEFPGNQFHSTQLGIWENFLRIKVFENKTSNEGDPAEIINSVKDWLDSKDDDAITGVSGAESDYYLGLDPSYVCANGPLNHIDELLNIKGITKDLLKADIESGNPDQTGATPALELGDLFTIYGLAKEKSENGGYRYPGRVNINTAGVDVLAALLPEGMADFAQDLVDFRDEKSEQENVFINPLDKGWYEKVIDLSESEIEKLNRSIRYDSDVFKVLCSARKNNAMVTLMVYIQREKIEDSGKWICRILQIERE